MSDVDILGSALDTEFNEQTPYAAPVWVAFAPQPAARTLQHRRQSSAAKDKNAKCDSRAPTSGDRWKDDGTSGTAQSEEKESRRSRKARARAEQKAEKKLHPSPQEILSGASDDSTVFRLNRESDTGPVEHKWRLKRPAPVRFQQLVTQLKFRLGEGNGECFYYVGVHDDGTLVGLSEEDLEASLETLHMMAAEACAKASVLRRLKGGSGRRCAIVHVTGAATRQLSCTDLRIAVAGSVDSGKSTLVAALSHGSSGHPFLDNGHGSARMAVFKHKHEIESGRTSSLSHQLLGYAADGRILNYSGVAPLTPGEITQGAARTLSLIDLGGHERFFKTWLLGMTSMLPAFTLLVVCGVHGLGRVGRQHLAVALALQVPIAVTVTKADIAEPHCFEAVESELRQVLAAVGSSTSAFSRSSSTAAAGGAPQLKVSLIRVASDQQACMLATEMPRNRVSSLLQGSGGRATLTVPLFRVSTVTGFGLQLLHTFLRALPTADATTLQSEAAHFQVDETFVVRGTGLVAAGVVICGRISVGDRLLLGPSARGNFSGVTVSSIHRSQVSVGYVDVNQSATLAIKACLTAKSLAAANAAAASVAADIQMSSIGTIAKDRHAAADISFRQIRQASVAFEEGAAEVDSSGEDSPIQQETEAAAAAAVADSEDASAAGAPEIEESAWLAERRLLREQATVPWLRNTATATATDCGMLPRTEYRSTAAGTSNTVGGTYGGRRNGNNSTILAARLDSREALPSSDCIGDSSDACDSAPCVSALSLSTPENGGCFDGSLPHSQPPPTMPRDTLSSSASVDIPVRSRGLSHSRGGNGHTDVPLSSSFPDRTGSAPSLLDVTPTNARKGAVLLDPSLQPQAVWEFQAMLVLLTGTWPARGLESGSWPPNPTRGAQEDGKSGSESDNIPPSQQESREAFSDSGYTARRGERPEPRRVINKPKGHHLPGGPTEVEGIVPLEKEAPASGMLHSRAGYAAQSGQQQRRVKSIKAEGVYSAVVHCGIVRQAARVVAMKEVALDDPSLPAGSMAPSVAAAAVLQSSQQGEGNLLGDDCQTDERFSTCAMAVTLRFLHRPEWLQRGASVILRGRGERGPAAAGYVHHT